MKYLIIIHNFILKFIIIIIMFKIDYNFKLEIMYKIYTYQFLYKNVDYKLINNILKNLLN